MEKRYIIFDNVMNQYYLGSKDGKPVFDAIIEFANSIQTFDTHDEAEGRIDDYCNEYGRQIFAGMLLEIKEVYRKK